MASGQATPQLQDQGVEQHPPPAPHPSTQLDADHPFFGMSAQVYDYMVSEQAKIVELQEHLQSAIVERNEITELMRAFSSKLESGESSTKRTKMPKPDTFSGQRSKLPAFLTTLRIYYDFTPTDFPTDRHKVIFACSLLRDSAFTWCEPYLRDYYDKTATTDETFFDSYDNFESILTTTFGDIDRVAISERRIQHIKQKTSVSAYATEFQQVASHLAWNQEALCWHYYQGLKDTVKDEVSRLPDGRPDNIDAMIETTVRIDNRLFERQLERGASRTYDKPRYTTRDAPNPSSIRSSNRPDYSRSDYYGPKPMELDALGISSSTGKLTPEERKRRFDNNLCMFCGKPGHRVAECDRANNPSKAPRQSIHALETDNPVERPSPPVTFSIPGPQNARSSTNHLGARSIRGRSDLSTRGRLRGHTNYAPRSSTPSSNNLKD